MKLSGRLCARSIKAIAIISLLLPLSIAVNPARAVIASVSTPKASAPTPKAHVYLLRGVLNIFSLGLDDIAAKLEAQGIPVTVANYLSWASLAEDAAAEVKSGRTRTIILVGHSSGATILPDMVARLDQLGTAPELVIGLDSVFRTKLSGHAGRYINFYVGNGNGEPVQRAKDYRGSLENINVQNVPGVGHLTIEKNQVMQQKVINAIDSVVFSRPKPAAASPEVSAAKPATGTADASRPNGSR